MKNQKTIAYVILAGIIFVFVLIFSASIVKNGNKPAIDEMVTEEQDSIAVRQKAIESQFSAWDGSHINLTKLIKRSMNDPASYEHVETKYWEYPDGLLVATTFRGNNAFGGKVLQTIKAEVTLQGTVTKTFD